MQILKLMREFNMDYTGIQPYIFTSEDCSPKELDSGSETILASPFRRFSIELDGRDLTSAENGGVTTSCIYCEELGPNNYEFVLDSHIGELTVFLVINKDTLTAYRNGAKVATQDSGDAYYQYVNLVNIYIEKIHSKKSGLVNRSGKAKFKDSTGIKRTYVPNDVIYVSATSKKSKTVQSQPGSERIRWLDGWSVSSHWRTINPETLGKDRNGERTVKGKTFVGDHVKGSARDYFTPRKVVI